MKLTLLSKKDLDAEFIRISQAYILATKGHPSDYIKKKSFLDISEELRKVLKELKRRRET